MNREVSRKLVVLIGFLARSRYILEKLFSRKPSASIVLGQKFRLRMKCLEVICSYLIRSLTHVFVIVKTNAFGIDGGRLVLGLFYILNMQRLFSAGTPLLSVLKDCYLV